MHVAGATEAGGVFSVNIPLKGLLIKPFLFRG